MTRLLNTPIIGPRAAIVDSSWIDMLAGLSPEGIRRIPPGFWAKAEPLSHRLASNPPAAAKLRRFAFIRSTLRGARGLRASGGLIFGTRELLVEPDVFHAVAVVDAIHHSPPTGPQLLNIAPATPTHLLLAAGGGRPPMSSLISLPAIECCLMPALLARRRDARSAGPIRLRDPRPAHRCRHRCARGDGVRRKRPVPPGTVG